MTWKENIYVDVDERQGRLLSFSNGRIIESNDLGNDINIFLFRNRAGQTESLVGCQRLDSSTLLRSIRENLVDSGSLQVNLNSSIGSHLPRHC